MRGDDEDCISAAHAAYPRGLLRMECPYICVWLTGDHDDRVSPLHSHKLLAELQYQLAGRTNAAQRNPLVSRIEVRTGHGAGKPTEKVIAEAADMLSFAAEVTDSAWVRC